MKSSPSESSFDDMNNHVVHYLDFEHVGAGCDYVVTVRPADTMLSFLFVYSLVAWILYSMVMYSPPTLGPGYKAVIATVLFGFAAMGTLHAVRNGGFVLAANSGGIFYRSASRKDKAVFIPWLLVDEIAWSADAENGSWVSLTLSPEVNEELPRPTHGDARKYQGWLSSASCYHLSFAAGSGNNNRKIVNRLNEFRAGVPGT